MTNLVSSDLLMVAFLFGLIIGATLVSFNASLERASERKHEMDKLERQRPVQSHGSAA